jgi:hypothetical protein
MTAHRPLSTWVAAVRLFPAAPVQWPRLIEINFGDERCDARDLPEFVDGWQRQAILLDRGYLALGLVRDGSGEAVVELDNRARPVRVSSTAAAIIGRLEESWPDGTLSGTELDRLAREDKIVRYLLADRLAGEGTPPPEVFRILPWDLVDRLASQLSSVLDGEPSPDDIIELEYWFTSAGAGFTAALEQLDEGLRDRDQAVARVAASALCTQLLAVVPARLPEPTRTALAALSGRLDEVDPFLRFAGRRAAAWLRTGRGTGEKPPARLPAELAAAADSETGVRTESVTTERPPFAVDVVVTSAGWAEITVRAPLSREDQVRIAQSYGVLLVPVLVTDEDGSTRYFLPLQPMADLAGQLDVELPQGGFVEADIDGPPIGVAEAALLEPAEVQRSIDGLRTRPGREPWTLIADRLPAAHRLRELIIREIGESE